MIPRLGLSVTMQLGGRLTKLPVKKPYRMQKMMMLASEVMPSQPKARIAVAQDAAAMMVMGPVRSARKLGMRRPGTEAAFMIERRYREKLGVIDTGATERA